VTTDGNGTKDVVESGGVWLCVANVRDFPPTVLTLVLTLTNRVEHVPV